MSQEHRFSYRICIHPKEEDCWYTFGQLCCQCSLALQGCWLLWFLSLLIFLWVSLSSNCSCGSAFPLSGISYWIEYILLGDWTLEARSWRVFSTFFWMNQDFYKEDPFWKGFCWKENDWFTAKLEVCWCQYQVCSKTRKSSSLISRNNHEAATSKIFSSKTLKLWYHTLLPYSSQLYRIDVLLSCIDHEDYYWKFLVFKPFFSDSHKCFRYEEEVVWGQSAGTCLKNQKGEI